MFFAPPLTSSMMFPPSSVMLLRRVTLYPPCSSSGRATSTLYVALPPSSLLVPLSTATLLLTFPFSMTVTFVALAPVADEFSASEILLSLTPFALSCGVVTLKLKLVRSSLLNCWKLLTVILPTSICSELNVAADEALPPSKLLLVALNALDSRSNEVPLISPSSAA